MTGFGLASSRTGRGAAALIVAVVAAALVGCGRSAGPSASSTSAPVPAASSATDTGPPPQEPTGTESPQRRTGGTPSVQVASLPIGGQAEDANPRCVQVQWLTGRLAPGFALDVTAVHVTSPFTTGGGCTHGPACAGHRFDPDNSDTAHPCFVGIEWRGSGDATTEGQLSLGGTLTCPAATGCGRVGDDLDQAAQTIGVEAPPTDQSSVASAPPSEAPQTPSAATTTASPAG